MQQTSPLPQPALELHVQPVVMQVWLCVLQHSPAVQSASVQHPAHAPLQQTWPPLHWADVVQPHDFALHSCVTVPQHSPAVQSESLQQPTHALLQHTWPPLHSALVVQPQAAALQVWVVVSQHAPPTQSPSVQQLPRMQTGTWGPASGPRASTPASGVRALASWPLWPPPASGLGLGVPVSGERVVTSLPASAPGAVDPPLPQAASTRPNATAWPTLMVRVPAGLRSRLTRRWEPRFLDVRGRMVFTPREKRPPGGRQLQVRMFSRFSVQLPWQQSASLLHVSPVGLQQMPLVQLIGSPCSAVGL